MTLEINPSLVSNAGTGVSGSVDHNPKKENFSQNLSVQDNLYNTQEVVYKDVNHKIHKKSEWKQNQKRLLLKTGVYSIWSASNLLNFVSLLSSKVSSIFQAFAGTIGTVPSQLADIKYSWNGFVEFIKDRKNFSILMMEKFFPFIRDVVFGTGNVFFKCMKTAAVWSETAKTILSHSAVALAGTIFGFATGCLHVVSGFLLGISAHLKLRSAEAGSKDYNEAKETRKHALRVFTYGTALTVLGALTLAGIGGPFTLAAAAGCAALYMAYLAFRAKTTIAKPENEQSQVQKVEKNSIQETGVVSNKNSISTGLSQLDVDLPNIELESLNEFNDKEEGELGDKIQKYSFTAFNIKHLRNFENGSSISIRK